MFTISEKCFKLVHVCGHALKVRHVSALYVSREKASENYVTLQPYMDFQQTFQNVEQLQHSIEKRRLEINLKVIKEKYKKYQDGCNTIAELEKNREVVASRLKEISKEDSKNDDLINQLKKKGKNLRIELQNMKAKFVPLEDEFIKEYLHLPNTLHKQCPDGDHEKLLFRSQSKHLKVEKSHLNHEKLIYFIENSRYYLLNEAAEFETRCPHALARYFLERGGFIQTSNPDFTRCVLLEANATPMNRYHKVLEANLQNKFNAAYLTGGGSFESFLGAVTKLCVYPNILPLKLISCGRLYERANSYNTSSLFTATQNNAVQTFVATTDLMEAEEQMENILNLCLDFYKLLNIEFRIVYVKAAELLPAESLRAQVEVYSPYEKRYICVGRVSNYKDFVSKRILFTMRKQNTYHFLHMVGGPILYTSRLIAALIEQDEILDYEKILKTFNSKTSTVEANTKALNEFKSLFK